MDKTIDFYNQNACDFIAGTIAADMSDARNRFLSYVEENGRILDWGCGSGRDALYFQSHGYDVVATDASKALCQKLLEKADFSVEILNNPCNLGIQASRINGLQSACGEWINFLDQDDLLFPEKYESYLKYMDQADVIISNGY